MKGKIALALLIAYPACGQSICQSLASGNWSNPNIWGGACGQSRVPGDGDFVRIGGSGSPTNHTVTIDQNIGTVAGGGIKRIDVHTGASGSHSILQVDGAAPRTIVFGSTGSDPIGSGTANNPGYDATMFGILLGRGRLDLSAASATNYVHLTTADGTSPIYISHRYGTLGGNSGTTVKLKYTILDRVGVDVAQYRGVDIEGYSTAPATVEIDNCRFNSPYRALSMANNFGSSSMRFASNTISGQKHHAIYVSSTPAVQIVIRDNTAYAPAADGYLLYAQNGLTNFEFARNVTEGSASYSLGALMLNAAVASTYWDIKDTVCVNYRPSVTASKCLGLRSASGATGMTVSGLLAEGQYQTIYHMGATDATDDLLITGVVAFHTQESSLGQGAMISYRGKFTLERSIGWLESSNLNIIWFALGSANVSTPTFRQNLARGVGTGNGQGRGFMMGEPSAPVTNALAHSNIAYNCWHGLHDGTSANTYVESYAGVGAHHNNTFNAPYYRAGGLRFDDGVNYHPHENYADTQYDPQLVDPNRRLGGYDAWLGGPGTAANFVQQAAKRCGLLGTYDPRYNPAAAINWVRQGFRTRNLRLATSGWSESGPTWAGPDPPILMFGVINQ